MSGSPFNVPPQYPNTPPPSQPLSRRRAVQTPLQLLKTAISRGHLLDWRDCYLQSPRHFLWPADAKGQAIPASQLDEAYQLYDIPIPKCPCGAIDAPPNATPNPKEFNIWVVKTKASAYHGQVAMACKVYNDGCGAWMSLSKFEKSRNLQVHCYPLRASPGPGLPNFDPSAYYGAANDSVVPPSPAPQASQPNPFFTVPPPPPGAFLSNNPFLVAPSPYQISSPPPSHSSLLSPLSRETMDLLQFFSNRGPANSQARIQAYPPVPSPTPVNMAEPTRDLSLEEASAPASPVLGSPTPPSPFMQPSRKSGFAISNSRRIGSSPQLSPTRRDASSSPVAYPSSPQLTRKRSLWSAQLLSSPTPASHEIGDSDSEESEKMLVERLKSEPDLPSQRWFGELNQLFEPPDLEYALKLNSEVPALNDNEFEVAWHHLNTTKGITSAQFWRMFDMCDCGAYFRKCMINNHRQFGCLASIEIPNQSEIIPETPDSSSSVPPSGLSLTRPTTTSPPLARSSSPPELGTNNDDLYT